MYTWIWRHLPGPTAARAAQALLLFLLVVALLFFVVFPWLEPYLPFDRVTQGATSSAAEAIGQCTGWPCVGPTPTVTVRPLIL